MSSVDDCCYQQDFIKSALKHKDFVGLYSIRVMPPFSITGFEFK